MQQNTYCLPLDSASASINPVLKKMMPQVDTIDIVLAEDDIDEQYFFKTAISELAIATHLKIVSDGQGLINYLFEPPPRLPDVIFLDITMPRKNGIECLAEIKGDKMLAHIPIIMYSNSIGLKHIAEAYEYRALYFLQKGNYTDLTKSIFKLLHLIANDPGQGTLENFKFSLTVD